MRVRVRLKNGARSLIMLLLAILSANAVQAQISLPYSQNFEGVSPLSDFSTSAGTLAQVRIDNSKGISSSSALVLEGGNSSDWSLSNAFVDNPGNWGNAAGSPAPQDFQASASLEFSAANVTIVDVEFSYEIQNNRPNVRLTNFVLEWSEDNSNWTNAMGPGTDVSGIIYRTDTGNNLVSETVQITGISGNQTSLWLRFRSLVCYDESFTYIAIDEIDVSLPLQTPMASTFPSAQETVPYTQSLTAVGGTPPYTFDRDPANQLPTGFDIVDQGGGNWALVSTLSGPNSGSYNFGIEITDSSNPVQTITPQFSIVVTVPPSPLGIASVADLPSAPASGSYSHFFSGTGGKQPYTWSLDMNAPAWLSIDANTGELSSSGVAAISGDSFTFDVTIEDVTTSSPVTKSFTLDVVSKITPFPGSLTWPAAEVTATYYHTLVAQGGEGQYEFSFHQGNMPAGLSIESNTGIVRGAPHFGTNNPSVPYTFDLSVSDVSFGGSQTEIFSYSLVVGDSTVLNFQITTDTLPTGQVGQPYEAQIVAKGGRPDYEFDDFTGPLPAGLDIDEYGRITGTPSVGTDGTNIPVTLRVSDSTLSLVSKGFTMNIDPAPPDPISVQSTTMPDAFVADPYSQSITVLGGVGPYSVSAVDPNDLPADLILTSASATISGMPQLTALDNGSEKTYTFDVLITDSDSPPVSETFTMSLTVKPSLRGPLAIQVLGSPPTLPRGEVGTAYNFELTATGGSAVKNWQIGAGSALPNGLNFSSNGQITGTPEAGTNGTYNVLIRVEDQASDFDEVLFNFVIDPESTGGGGGGGGPVNPPTSLNTGGGGCNISPAEGSLAWFLLILAAILLAIPMKGRLDRN